MIFQHVTLPEGKVQELISEFLDVDSKEIQGQVSLKKESLEKVEAEVKIGDILFQIIIC